MHSIQVIKRNCIFISLNTCNDLHIQSEVTKGPPEGRIRQDLLGTRTAVARPNGPADGVGTLPSRPPSLGGCLGPLNCLCGRLHTLFRLLGSRNPGPSEIPGWIFGLLLVILLSLFLAFIIVTGACEALRHPNAGTELPQKNLHVFNLL